MLQQDRPDDYVVATGEAHSVREFCEIAFSRVGLDWERYVAIDPRYYRPAEVDYLLGDSTKARRQLEWTPKVTFQELVEMMVDHDLTMAENESQLSASHAPPAKPARALAAAAVR
jgi:GDPmannose 4,6-dehydratase